jgi:carbon-monoxide dehydrogenase large subunit
MSDPAATGFIGRSVLRREDHRLLRGRGVFVGDLQLPGMLHAAIVRSDHAHARIVGIDTAAALPGRRPPACPADRGAHRRDAARGHVFGHVGHFTR